MKQFHSLILWIGLLTYSGNIYCQTKVDLQNQSSKVDFENALYTRPVKVVSTLPSACLVGEMVYLSSAAQGNNIHACVADNVWALQGGLTAGPANTFLTSNGTQSQWIGASGDLTGTPSLLQVSGLRNRPVAATAPATGQVLSWDGTQWAPLTVNGAPGTVTLKSGTTTVGNGGVLQYVAGLGMVNSLSLSGGELRIQQDVDTAVVMLRTDFQAGTAIHCVAAVAANAYSCALNPAPAAYVAGMRFFVQPAGGNTGAATLNINGLGAVPLRRADGVTVLAGNELLAGRLTPVWFDGTVFRLVETQLPLRTSEYCDASATANAYSCSLDPVPAAYVTGMRVFLKAGATNTGAATLNVNGLGAVAVRRADGVSELLGWELEAGRLYPLWYDGAVFRQVETQVLTRTSAYCGGVSSADAYSCTLLPGISALGAGMQVMLKADADNTGAVTLDINGLGAVAVRRADGVTELLAGDLLAGSAYPLWHDGTIFRMVETPSPVKMSAAARPSCELERRGQIWHEFSAPGVKDSVAVCAKDAANAYAWRTLY